jgi:phage minor structural protein
MLVVKGINGQEEMLADFKDVKRKRRVNGDHSISFYLLNSKNNQHVYNLVDKRAKITDKYGDEYIVIGISKRGHLGKSIVAKHIFFDDLANNWQYDLRNGYTNFTQCMDFIFQGTGWKWISQGAFAATRFENFGDETRTDLLQKALNRYDAEFKIDNKTKTVTFKNQIGTETDAQFRYGHNLKTFDEDTDMSSFYTVIRGYGKKDEQEIMIEYVSPMEKIFGRLVQKPIRDERYNSTDTLLERCKKDISDVPDTRFKATIATLLDNGLSPLHKFDFGDYVYMLYEEADVKVKIRVIEIEDDPTDKTKSPIIELSTFKELKTMSAIQAQFQQTQKQVQQLLDDGGNLNLALKRLYMNTQTFADNTGVWYVDPEDKNRYVHIGAGGLDCHRGLIRVEREDGYAIIIGGVLQHGFDINGHEPPYTEVDRASWWWVMDKADRLYNCQYYTFEHKSRYLNVLIGQLAEEGTASEVVILDGDGNTVLARNVSNNTNPNDQIAVYGKLLEIDLGVPTGEERSVYIRMRPTVEGKRAYCRKIRMWLDR